MRLWDPVTAAPVGDPLTGHTDRMNAVAAVPLPDRRTLLATGSWDQTVRLWNVDSGQVVRVFGLGFVVDAVAAIDGVLIAGGAPGLVAVQGPSPIRMSTGGSTRDDSD